MLRYYLENNSFHPQNLIPYFIRRKTPGIRKSKHILGDLEKRPVESL